MPEDKSHIKNSAALRVISRSSNLALKQVEEVFSNFPGISYEVIPVSSFGDKHKDISLINNKITDFFTRELDEALLKKEADIAVHSAKDLPYPLSEGLEIIALLEAFDKTDSVVSRGDLKLTEFPSSPRIGTSSLLRKAELMKIRDDIRVVNIRGTIEERIRQVDNGYVDAVIVATCALKRLGLEGRIAEVLPFETHPLQGHLAVVAASYKEDLKEIFEKKDIRQNFGKVRITGFGPGNPGLLTLKGKEALEWADVIFYDDLLDKEYLLNFPGEKIFVGKRKGNHSHEQEQINQLLYKAAVDGKKVVRLKGGDPMIFAHGGEETEYLRSRLIDVEIIPGITAALACAAFAQVPLTHRNISSSVTFISGQSVKKTEIPASGTVVCYMGASNIKELSETFIKKGWNSDTPILMGYNVSGTDQQLLYTTLHKATNEKFGLKTPLIIIIGDVVRLKRESADNMKKPSFLVTGSYPEKFAAFGDVIHEPLIEIKPLNDYNHLTRAIENIKEFDLIIFTSRHAVRYFLDFLITSGKDLRSLAALNIVSIGNTTTAALRKYGLLPDLQPEDESSEGLIRLFSSNGLTSRNILIPRSNIGLPVLPEGLKKLGNKVMPVYVYENVRPGNRRKRDISGIDYIVFSSPSCVDNFFLKYPVEGIDHKYIVQGPETRKRLEDHKIPACNIINKTDYEKIA